MMTDIPDDVMRIAEDLIPGMDLEPGESMRGGIVYYTAKAIMAERERCAKVAEGFQQNRDWVPGSLYDNLRREVGAAIRKGSALSATAT